MGAEGGEVPPDEVVSVTINDETFLLRRLSLPDASVVQRYVSPEAPSPADATHERLRMRTALAAVNATIARADRDRFREAMRRNRERGEQDAVRAARRLLDADRRDTA